MAHSRWNQASIERNMPRLHPHAYFLLEKKRPFSHMNSIIVAFSCCLFLVAAVFMATLSFHEKTCQNNTTSVNEAAVINLF